MRSKSAGKYFFFFDRYVIGGAQRVHIDILKSIPEIHKQVYFTRYSPNDKLKDEFYNIENTHNKDIHKWCDNLLFRLFTVHYYCFYINRHKEAVVFSANSTFFYDMLPFLSTHVIRAELLHNFTYGNNGMEFFGLANYKMLSHRLVVDAATQNNIIDQYRQFNIPQEYIEKIRLIEPGVDVPNTITKEYNLPLKVLYAGRGTPQKRIYLLNRVAEESINKNIPVEFHFAGTMMDELSEFVKKNSVVHGEISNTADMCNLYRKSHVILMTSAYEGFPMLIKEGMAYGCIPVVTALEGNKSHLKNNSNALLMMHPENEEAVVNEAIAHLNMLCTAPELLRELSTTSYQYARDNFSIQIFTEKYRAFLSSL